MKSKVLFVGFSLKVGGIERALVEQLKSIDYNNYQVDLFLFSKSGAYLSDVPSQVSILKESKLLKYYGLTQSDARKSGRKAVIVRSLYVIIAKLFGSSFLLKLILPHIKIKQDYDIAISYFHNGNLNSLYCGCNEFVLNNVSSRKKIAWIHSDYIYGKIYNEYNNQLYKRFDSVVNVSNAMKQKFDSLCIVPVSRSAMVYNRYDIKNCLSKSVAFQENTFSGAFNIVTVGRLELEKGINKLFEVANKLKIQHFPFTWYFVGGGVLEDWCNQYIKENQLEDTIVLLGQQSNPYPYIANANLLVSGSQSETFGLSILESLLLGTPVIAYRYEAIHELIDGTNGIVCDSFNDMQESILKCMTNTEWYNYLKNNVHTIIDYNSKNVDQFNDVLKYESDD